MIKALSVIALSAAVAATITVLPAFAPQVEASTPTPVVKADRLETATVAPNCSQQAWPHFDASCLRAAGSKAPIREARLVTASRIP